MPNFIFEDQIEQGLVQKLRFLHGFDALVRLTDRRLSGVGNGGVEEGVGSRMPARPVA